MLDFRPHSEEPDVHVLVTGGAGFIGSHLVEHLVRQGHRVDVVDDLSSGRLANLAVARGERSGELQVHTLDARADELDVLVARRRPDVVVHLASAPRGVGPVEDFDVVVRGAVNVLAACQRHGVARVVTVASSHVYDERGVGTRTALAEDRGFSPRTTRGAARLAMLEMLRGAVRSDGPDFAFLVLGDVYGPRATTGMVARLLAARAAGEPLVLAGSGEHGRDLVHVDDVVDALERALTRGQQLVVNIGTGVATSVLQLARLCGVEVVGGRGGSDGSAGSDGPAGSVGSEVRGRVALDKARAAVQLGWAPRIAVRDGIAELLALQ
jgi:UDP-glucose 4-epimerase